METRMIIVIGHVQGVGFRFSTKMIADELGITGYAENVQDYVEILATGSAEALDTFTRRVVEGASPSSSVNDYSVKQLDLDDSYKKFSTK
ncbi:acylphosphatase [Salinicoccus sediminis]|uniref:acylphosphatase n=1 Tax=Salinicoccus sediminis TaxID=1432562 RepID=A0A0M2SSM0_9STAP|nr:acylphosphatase [Salinicoccus sediminis]KKK35640.1 acylphosphatase [Salinicoccus sediminis]